MVESPDLMRVIRSWMGLLVSAAGVSGTLGASRGIVLFLQNDYETLAKPC